MCSDINQTSPGGNSPCKVCPNFCIDCSNSTTCTKCNFDFIITPNGSCAECGYGLYPLDNFTCQVCEPNCAHCANNYSCIDCAPGFSSDGADNCWSCNVSNCILCQPADICTTCIFTHKLDNTTNTCNC